VRIPLRHGQGGVPKDLLDDADVYALFEQQQGRRRVACVMQSRATNACGLAEPLPVLPVIARLQRLAERVREAQVVVLALLPRRLLELLLRAPVRLELSDQRSGDDERPCLATLRLAELLISAEPLRACWCTRLLYGQFARRREARRHRSR
jgi:hypothetical protein